jgi:hypothetical protein
LKGEEVNVHIHKNLAVHCGDHRFVDYMVTEDQRIRALSTVLQ